METETMGEVFTIKEKKSLISNVFNWIKELFNKISCKLGCCSHSNCSYNSKEENKKSQQRFNNIKSDGTRCKIMVTKPKKRCHYHD